MLGNYETFEYRGHNWTRFCAPPADEAFIAGLDVGQSQDPTALIVMRHHREPLDHWDVDKAKRTTRQEVKERMPSGSRWVRLIPTSYNTCGTS